VSIATKTGDDGTTALMFGHRVPKTDARVEACGAIDELTAALGVARSGLSDAGLVPAILSIQQELITVMGEIAVTGEDRARYAERGYSFVTEAMVERLTGLIEEVEATLPPPAGWALPGGTSEAAALDLARAICRRAERRAIDAGFSATHLQRYLNRLSDLLWLWGRKLEAVPKDSHETQQSAPPE
jgi:cob(I)alamin adenosyltransferase